MDYAPGSTLDFKFSTIANGVMTAIVGGQVSVYKDNSLVQSSFGVTLTSGFDGVVGLNNVRVDTSSDSVFYSPESSYHLVVTAGTVGGKNIAGFVIDDFTLNRSSDPNTTEIDYALSVSHGYGAWGATGTAGAHSITTTVTNGVVPLQDALVRVVEGVNNFTATTDFDGHAHFSLDVGSYTVTVSKDGYQFTPTVRTVVGNQTGTLTEELVLVQVSAPINPGNEPPGTGHHPQV